MPSTPLLARLGAFARPVVAPFLRVSAQPRTRRVARWLSVIVAVLGLQTLIRCTVFDPYVVPTASMYPTIRVQDEVLARPIAYGLRLFGHQLLPVRTPRRGEVIVFWQPAPRPRTIWAARIGTTQDPHLRLVKRVIGVAGDTLQMIGGHLLVNRRPYFVDGEPLPTQLTPVDSAAPPPFAWWHVSPRLPAPTWTRDTWGPYVVPRRFVFVLGDNRDHSLDSRYFGPVALHRVIAPVTSYLVPHDGSGAIDWPRVGAPVP